MRCPIKPYTIASWVLLWTVCFALAGVSDVVKPQSGESENSLPEILNISVSSDTLSVNDIESKVVGTWLEDPKRQEASPQEWVFTEDGTLKQYVAGELSQTLHYQIVEQCEDPFYGTLEVSGRQIALLELTYHDGAISCTYITQWEEDHPNRPEYFALGTEYGIQLFERH